MTDRADKPAPRAVLWDLDGTLVDSTGYHWPAWREAMEAEAFELTHEMFVADFGKRNDEILRFHFGEGLSDAEVARIALAKEERYRARVREGGIELLPGVAAWLERLRDAGWRQALATSAPPGNIEAIFDASGIARYFDAVVSSEEVKRGKPAPDVFLAAAERLGVDASRCVVVEDAPTGVAAGRSAGMRTVGVLTTNESLDADLVVRSLEDLSLDAFDTLLGATDGAPR